jgi:hypothetical protein
VTSFTASVLTAAPPISVTFPVSVFYTFSATSTALAPVAMRVLVNCSLRATIIYKSIDAGATFFEFSPNADGSGAVYQGPIDASGETCAFLLTVIDNGRGDSDPTPGVVLDPFTFASVSSNSSAAPAASSSVTTLAAGVAGGVAIVLVLIVVAVVIISRRRRRHRFRTSRVSASSATTLARADHLARPSLLHGVVPLRERADLEDVLPGETLEEPRPISTHSSRWFDDDEEWVRTTETQVDDDLQLRPASPIMLPHSPHNLVDFPDDGTDPAMPRAEPDSLGPLILRPTPIPATSPHDSFHASSPCASPPPQHGAATPPSVEEAAGLHGSPSSHAPHAPPALAPASSHTPAPPALRLDGSLPAQSSVESTHPFDGGLPLAPVAWSPQSPFAPAPTVAEESEPNDGSEDQSARLMALMAGLSRVGADDNEGAAWDAGKSSEEDTTVAAQPRTSVAAAGLLGQAWSWEGGEGEEGDVWEVDVADEPDTNSSNGMPSDECGAPAFLESNF